jgi:iron(III) transport system substrate-binding protein
MRKNLIAVIAAMLLMFPGSPGRTPAATASSPAFDALVAAAKQEGSVVVNGPPIDVVRDAMTKSFETTYGIKVSYVSGGGPAAAARTRSERAAGKYTLDVLVSGCDTQLLTFLPNGWLDPVEPVLIQPGTTDPHAWKDGHVWYADPKHTILRTLAFVTPEVSVNTNLVKSRELTTWKSLLDPRWEGKIVLKDPTISGAGGSLISYFYVTFGPDFVKRLYVTQKPVITRDQRQGAQWLAQGTYPVVIGLDAVSVDQFKKRGYPVELRMPNDGPGILSGGYGFVSLVNRAPHPNAAKLFVNWTASREGAQTLAQSLESLSLRVDVSHEGLPAYEIPDKHAHYVDTYDYTFVTQVRDVAFDKVRELLGL